MYKKWQIRFNRRIFGKSGRSVRQRGAVRVPTSVGNPMYKKGASSLTNKYAGLAQFVNPRRRKTLENVLRDLADDIAIGLVKVRWTPSVGQSWG